MFFHLLDCCEKALIFLYKKFILPSCKVDFFFFFLKKKEKKKKKGKFKKKKKLK